ncbi:hypothetical protein [Kitasatospora sp. NPDC090091]|uniref:hypothetical protein n=1 Tax=Kitasatospora sp. NPDC090091 TaxID=3364081 RepID=UPI003803A123
MTTAPNPDDIGITTSTDGSVVTLWARYSCTLHCTFVLAEPSPPADWWFALPPTAEPQP